MNPHIAKSAVLRGQRKFDEAIAEIERNESTFGDLLSIALLQAFYAAQEMGDTEKAKELARRIVELEPGLPSIQPYL